MTKKVTNILAKTHFFKQTIIFGQWLYLNSFFLEENVLTKKFT